MRVPSEYTCDCDPPGPGSERQCYGRRYVFPGAGECPCVCHTPPEIYAEDPRPHGPTRVEIVLAIIALIVAAWWLLGCHDSLTEPTRDPAGQVVTGWRLTMGLAGPAIQQGQHGGFACEIPRLPSSVHYVEGDYRGPAHPSALTLTMHIEASADAVYTGEVDVERPGHDTGTGYVTLMIRSSGGERWWAGGARLPLDSLSNKSQTMTVQLVPEEWSDVYGQRDARRFADAAASLSSVGVTMGGASFYGHGAALTSGSARFVVDEVEVSR